MKNGFGYFVISTRKGASHLLYFRDKTYCARAGVCRLLLYNIILILNQFNRLYLINRLFFAQISLF